MQSVSYDAGKGQACPPSLSKEDTFSCMQAYAPMNGIRTG